MTNQQHPITLPPELRRSWLDEAWHKYPDNLSAWIEYVAEKSAQWGADQELEETLGLMETLNIRGVDYIRNVRRPKPPSLKEQALKGFDYMSQFALGELEGTSDYEEYKKIADTVRQALESL